MARTGEPHPDSGSHDIKQQGRQGEVRPAFIVDSAGVATPGNLVRGDGFTMRNGEVWPPYRRRRNLH